MDEYYSKYRSADPKEEINKRYPAVLYSDAVLNEVIGIANAAFWKRIAHFVCSIYRSDWDLTEDIMQNASVRLFELSKKNFNNKEFRVDFYSYVKNIYENVAWEVIKEVFRWNKKQPSESMEAYAERMQEQEHSHKDHGIIKQTNPETWINSPERIFEDEELGRQRTQMEKIMLSVIKNTEEPPHMVIAFCYSVCLPVILKALIENLLIGRLDLSRIIGETERKIRKESGAEAILDGKRCLDNIKENMKNIEGIGDLPYDTEKFCLLTVVIPELQRDLQFIDKRSESAAAYQVVLEAALKEVKEIESLDRNNNILVECAKVLMNNDQVRSMSDKFQEVHNMAVSDEQKFVWGQRYKENLEKEYRNVRHGIFIPNEGDLIFADMFSRPASEVVQNKKNQDYLGKNIRNFSSRIMVRLLREGYEIAKNDYEVSEESIRRIRIAYEINAVKSGGKKVGKDVK